ncbi:MAG TPA: DUF916 domain-containing protein [Anaerolineae bacterium]|nr:DUF916 domain-containing protein [Anaerolineae bacterium]HID83941.1 DUF916 domain-containing protein [Anaerolineales bacterium]HIQ09194.1 DUF916 domain-containing protein [Anaerolineaceae bacterium]
MSKGKIRLWLPLILLGLWAAGPGPGFLIQPIPQRGDNAPRPFFDYQVPPGAIIHDAVVLTNLTDHPLTLILYPADGQTASNGGVTFPPREQSPQGPGRWITLSQDRITLQPHSAQAVAFRLQVPANARGESMAGLIAQPEAPPSSEQRPFTVTLIRRVAVAVRIRVVSAQAPLAFHLRLVGLALRVSPEGQQTLQVRLYNPGYYGVKGEGQLLIFDKAGQRQRARAIQLDYLLPGATVTLAVPLAPPLSPGTYRVSLHLRHNDKLEFTTHALFTVPEPSPIAPLPMPQAGPDRNRWLALAASLLALLVLLEGWELYRLRRRLNEKPR